ncbi:MAG: hypothetical protein WCF85_10855 [Rhodospirillaceae bacterium]
MSTILSTSKCPTMRESAKNIVARVTDNRATRNIAFMHVPNKADEINSTRILEKSAINAAEYVKHFMSGDDHIDETDASSNILT